MIFLSVLLLIGGCESTREVGKVLWGSSTRALERERLNASTQSYRCSFYECHEEILHIIAEAEYLLFQDNRIKGVLVVMQVPGSVDTTEVGIFLDEMNASETKIEISSLSSFAKDTVAREVLPKLEKIFETVE